MVLLEEYDVAITKGHKILALIEDLSVQNSELTEQGENLSVPEEPFLRSVIYVLPKDFLIYA